MHDGDNFVVIHVNNQRKRDGVPTLNTDWWNYGGLTRDVSLIETPETFVDDYSLQLQRGRGSTHRWVGARRWRRRGHAGHGEDSGVESRADCRRPMRKGALHSRSRRRICNAGRRRIRSSTTSRSVAGSDHLKDSIGFRTIEVQGDNILLNGKPIFLRGVSIHAEAPYRSGRAWSEQDAETLLGWAKELGAISCDWRTIRTTSA